MKKLYVVFALILLLYPQIAFCNWPYLALQQSQSVAVNSSSVTVTFDRDVTNTNLIFCAHAWESTTNLPSDSDTRSTSYTVNASATGGTVKVAVASGTLTSSGSDVITSAITSGAWQTPACVEAPPNWALTVDCSASSTFSGSPATVTTPTCTTTQNDDFVITIVGADNSAGWCSLQASTAYTDGWISVGSSGNADSECTHVNYTKAKGASLAVTLDTGMTLGSMLTVAFKSNALQITSPAAAPDGDTSHAYSYTELAAGGVNTLTWSVSAGALPTGLSINSSTGAITGTPSVSNNYTATIQATDGTSTVTKSTTFKIATSINTISVLQSASNAGQGGQTLAYSSNVTSGSLLLVVGGYKNFVANMNYCTDSLNTPFHTLTAYQMITNDRVSKNFGTDEVQLWAGVAPSGGADTVRCGNINAIAEFSNANFPYNDNILYSHGTGASPVTITTGTLTTLMYGDVLWGGCLGSATTSSNVIDSPFTVAGSGSIPEAGGYRIITTITGYTMSCDQSSNTDHAWVIGLAALRPSGGTVVPPGGVRHKSIVE